MIQRGNLQDRQRQAQEGIVELICLPKLTQLFLINPVCLCFEASSLYVKIRYNQTLKDKLFKSLKQYILQL